MEQERLTAMMLEAYQQRRIPHWFVFRPYFDWKKGLRPYRFSASEIKEMRRVALSLLKRYEAKHPEAWDHIQGADKKDPCYPWCGYGEDKEAVCILNQINEELTSFLILSMS